MKKYSKKQILNAISYWKSKLNEMQTSVNSLVDSFIKIYGEGALCSNTRNFILTGQNAAVIYDILNADLFSSSLDRQEIKCLNEYEMSLLYRRLGYSGNPSDYYAQYFPDLKKNPDPNGLPLIGNEIFVFNVSNCPVSLSFAISSICHEMIHKYDIHRGTLRREMKDFFENEKQYEEHATQAWIEKSDLANKKGLTVIPNGAGLGVQKLCDISAARIKRAVYSDENGEKLDEGISNIEISGESTATAWKADENTYRIAFG